VTHVEVPAGHSVLRPAQKDVARRLHGPLPLDNPPAGMPVEFRPEAFEHGFSGFLELQE